MNDFCRSFVQDRQGRLRTITVCSIEQDDASEYWFELTPTERIELMGECVLDGLRVRGFSEVPRMQRTYRILERQPQEKR